MADSPPPAHPPCPTCAGPRVEVNIRTDIDRQAVNLRRQTRRGWGSRDVTPVRALACTGCGLVTLHVTDLAKLQTEVAEHSEGFKWEQ